MKIKSNIISWLYISGDEGISYNNNEFYKHIEFEEFLQIINSINYEFKLINSPLVVNRYDELFILEVSDESMSMINKENIKEINLSKVNYEILSIVSQNYGITRSEVSKIRGVNSDASMKKLEDSNFITRIGINMEKSGATMFSVSTEFFKFFNISSIDDLPKMEKINFENIDVEEIEFLSDKFDKDKKINFEELSSRGDRNGKNS